MLDRSHRLTDSRSFTRAVREGRRAGTPTMVIHLLDAAQGPSPDSTRDPAGDLRSTLGSPPRVGFVVGRAVGAAVTRNRVRRRLRHLVRDRLSVLPGRALLVVRALPAAATASSVDLGRDLDRALRRLLREPAR